MKNFALSLRKFFKIDERGSSISKELLGGLTIFLAMVYILPVNSFILSGTGMPIGAVFAATAIAAAIASILMGLFANYPIGLASGMGLNAFFTYTIVGNLGYTWQEALACVLVSGLLFLTLSLTGLRRKVINAIPRDLKIAVGAGIGFFIAFIGLKNAGIVVGSGATFVTFGELNHATVLLAVFGIFLVFILHSMNNKISKFAVIISIVVTGLVGIIIGAIFPSLAASMPAFGGTGLGGVGDVTATFGQSIIALPKVLGNPISYAVIFSLLFVDFFDTAGTLVAVGHDAGLINKEGELIGGGRALISDATGTVVGALIGTSNVTSYIESTTGIKQGARTGLSAVVVGVLFIISLLFYPLFSFVGSIPVTLSTGGTVINVSPATSLALVFVGSLMASQLKEINWKDGVIASTTFIIIIMMVLAYSISEGLVFGFIFYTVLMLASKRGKEVDKIMYILSGLFVIYYIVKFIVLM